MNLENGPLVVIPEPIRSMGWTYDVERSILEPLGIRLVVPDTAEEAAAALPDADVVFTSSKLGAADIERLGSDCVGILCYSVGMDYVDAAAAKARGIPIWNCPTSNNEEVSDHAMLLILATQRRLLPLALAAQSGDWDVYEWPLLGQIHRLRSRTVGIIGLGRIGHLVAQKLHGFRPTVIAYDPYIEGTRDPEVELVSLDELAARSDIVVSCAALTDTSRGIIGARFPVEDEAGRPDRQRLARRDRRRGRTPRRPRIAAMSPMRASTCGRPSRPTRPRTGSPAGRTSSSPSTSRRARWSPSRGSMSRPRSRSSRCCAKRAGCRRRAA